MELKNKIYESIGQASMCWKPIPSGVFDSTKALQIGDELWKEIEKQRETIEKLREVLSYYADLSKYETKTFLIEAAVRWSLESTEVQMDEGEKARRVLEETN